MSTTKRHALMADARKMESLSAGFRRMGDVASVVKCDAKTAAIYVKLAAARK